MILLLLRDVMLEHLPTVPHARPVDPRSCPYTHVHDIRPRPASSKRGWQTCAKCNNNRVAY